MYAVCARKETGKISFCEFDNPRHTHTYPKPLKKIKGGAAGNSKQVKKAFGHFGGGGGQNAPIFYLAESAQIG